MTRVIAGEHRGRRLRTPPAKDCRTRPTSDRTKTVLFDLLGPLAHVELALDLFAGTGALGIEALSRGAGRAVFVEQQTHAVALIEANLDLLRLTARSEVVKTRALEFVVNDGRAWDLILADPPYESGETAKLVEAVGEFGLLRPGGRLALEHEPGLALPDGLGTLSVAKRRGVGSSELTVYVAADETAGRGGEGA